MLQSSQRVGSPSRRQVPLLHPRLLRDSLDDLHRAYNQDQILWKDIHTQRTEGVLLTQRMVGPRLAQRLRVEKVGGEGRSRRRLLWLLVDPWLRVDVKQVGGGEA